MEETGECGEQELNHSDGQAEKLSRPEAARNLRAGRRGGYRIFALVRAAIRGIRFRAMDRRYRTWCEVNTVHLVGHPAPCKESLNY
jgi:hypothetical protein